jgi:thymidylate synthase (FAD)
LVKLISITPDAEATIAHCARVSSPQNQGSSPDRLLAYCIKNKHWSIFEMANMCVEIETSRAISAQLLRHRSFSFQEFSQRYAKSTQFITYPARRQDEKNRQNSIDDLPDDVKDWFRRAQDLMHNTAETLYEKALAKGIAKEQARFLLPLSTLTKVYMTGSIRSWIHYLELRCGNGTQLEHQEVANQIKSIFIEQVPTISTALGWKEQTIVE